MSNVEAPKCPKCGEADCRRVEVAKPLRLPIGLAGLAAAMVITIGVGLLLKEFVSLGWLQLLTLPLFLASYFGVGFLVEYLVGMRWHCRACDADFRYQARAA